MTKVFVAGSRKLGRLNEEVRHRLSNLISQNFQVLVGDANGVDKSVQTYLADHAYKNVVVYCSGNHCRNNVGQWTASFIEVDKSKKGRDFYMEKDKKMAEDADYGLMIWDGKSAGTLNNVIELLNRKKKTLLYFSPSKEFFTISEPEQISHLLEKCSQDVLDTLRKKAIINLHVYDKVQKSMNFSGVAESNPRDQSNKHLKHSK